MSNVSNTVPVTTDPGLTLPPAPPIVTPAEPAATNIENAANLRLVIEEDPASGSYIYKTLDRRTGEVVQQFPREDVLKMKDAVTYNAGNLVSARV